MNPGWCYAQSVAPPANSKFICYNKDLVASHGILAHMNCPVDNTPLSITDRQGVEIDFCPKCRGVWLDRGELDKIIERGQQFNAPQVDEHSDRREHDSYSNDSDHNSNRSKHNKKESFLGDLFDF